MNTHKSSNDTSFSEVIELKDDDLQQVSGGADVDSKLESLEKQHGNVTNREVKTRTDHHGFLWLKKAEEKNTKLTFQDGHVANLTERYKVRGHHANTLHWG